MKRYVLSKAADRDLDEIWNHIAEDSEDAASAWVDKLLDAMALLGTTPRLGRARPDLLPPPAMFWPVGDYLIIYRIASKGIQVNAVVHGARNIPKVFGSTSKKTVAKS